MQCKVIKPFRNKGVVQGIGVVVDVPEAMISKMDGFVVPIKDCASLSQVFSFEDHAIRTVEKDGDIWFVAVDVCNVLDINNVTMAVSKLDDDEVTLSLIEGSHRETNVVNESGLYSLIMTSRKPEAKKFKKWVTSEVLPSIRKTGIYGDTMAVLSDPAAMRGLLLTYTEKVLQLEAVNAEMKPKAEFYDTVAESDTDISMASAAKILNCGVGRTKLFQFLRDEKILSQTNEPYQNFMTAGYFRVTERPWHTPNGAARISLKTVVTQKGLDFIRKRLAAKKEI